MSFTLEVVKNGKDRILFNNSKYRESYSLKSGDLVWRCLGKTCKAWIKTNKEKTSIYEANEAHIGLHPATMRPSTPSTPPPLKLNHQSHSNSPVTGLTPISVKSSNMPLPSKTKSTTKVCDKLPSIMHTTENSSDTRLTSERSHQNISHTSSDNTQSGYETEPSDTALTPPEHQTPSLTELISPYVTLNPEPPKFINIEDENAYLRQRIAELVYTNNALTDKLISLEKDKMQLDETIKHLNKSINASLPGNEVDQQNIIASQLKVQDKTSPLLDASTQTETIALSALHGIHILEADMGDVIDEWKSSSEIAFAHTISGDFSHPRHMSAGVAVTFKARFGKPQVEDCLTRSLAYQSTYGEAAVYSLITKEHYNGKPSACEYDLAFNDFTEDFKKRGFKTLVCSPMGCVRDLIELDHFALKINQFHKITGATVVIVTKDQQAKRVLRQGLPHTEFVKQLKSKIKQNCWNTKKWYTLPDEDMNLYIEKLLIPTNTLVLEPTVSHFIMKSESTEDINTLLKDRAADTFAYIMAPVNDRSDDSREGGAHWSLLLYTRETDTYFHLDSMEPMNSKHAERLAARLNGGNPVNVVQIRCCRQEGSVECGTYVLHFIQMICRRIQNKLPVQGDHCFLQKFSISQIYDDIAKYKLLNQFKGQIAKQKITLLSDSHGRGLRHMLQARLGEKCEVLSVVKPNATLENVVCGLDQEISGLNSNDHLIVLGGTNNVHDQTDYDVKPFVKELAHKTQNTNVILCTVPLRYDKPHLNKKIRKINIDLIIESLKYEHIKIISLSNILAQHYTTKGLHLNYSGKKRLSRLVVDKINVPQLNC